MKTLIIIFAAITTMLGFTTNVTAQTYDYSVKWSDTSTYKTTCGKVVAAQWSVKNDTCEMTTPHFRVEASGGCTVSFNFKINQDGNSDTSSTCNVYHKIDEGEWILDTLICGGGSAKVHTVSNSVNLNYSHYIAFKIRLITYTNTEFWAILGGDMNVTDGDSGIQNISSWSGTPPVPQEGNPIMPVELMIFNGKTINGAIELNWATASETNNDYFTIEKSQDAINFETEGFIKGAGNSNEILQYSTIDYDPFQDISYYRLKQTDFDGKFSYSNLVKVDFVNQLEDNVSIYPNPFNTSATIMIKEVSQMINYELRIYNVLGAEVMNTSITNQITTLETSDLPSGIYSYKLFEDDKTIQSGKLISQQ